LNLIPHQKHKTFSKKKILKLPTSKVILKNSFIKSHLPNNTLLKSPNLKKKSNLLSLKMKKWLLLLKKPKINLKHYQTNLKLFKMKKPLFNLKTPYNYNKSLHLHKFFKKSKIIFLPLIKNSKIFNEKFQ
jgi:hypothetical protein